MDFQTIVKTALELRAEMEDLKSASYTIVDYNVEGAPLLYFIASFSMDKLCYEYTVADENFIAVRSIDQLGTDAVVQYGKFVEAMEAYVGGEPHPFADKIVSNGATVKTPSPKTGFESDHDIDDSCFNLMP